MLSTPFWQRAAQLLPRNVRERYALELERAERVDLFVAAMIDAWRSLQAAFAERLYPQRRRMRTR